MRRGPKPKPTRLRVLEGNPGRRPLPANEPRPKAVVPRCPQYLDADARRRFKQLAPPLARLRILSELDVDALAAYCDAYSRWRAAARELRRTPSKGGGLVYETEATGMRRRNPLHEIVKEERRAMIVIGAELGLTPSGRTRLEVGLLAPDAGGSASGDEDGKPAPKTDADHFFGAP